MDQNLKEEVSLGTQEFLLKGAQAFKGLPIWQRVVLGLFIAGTVPGYFLARAVTEFGFTRTYAKYAVTAKQLVINPKPIIVGGATILPLGENQYAVYALIENQNLDLALSDARYVVELKNSVNDTVGRSTGAYYLLPGQKRYLVVARIPAQEAARSVTVTFSNEVWQNRLSIPTVSLAATEPRRYVQPDPLAYVVEGEVLNNSPFIVKQMTLSVLLFDSGNKVVAATKREEFDVLPRSRRAYKLLWPGITGANITRAQVQLDTNTLDDGNLRVQDAEMNAAGSLGGGQ